MRSTEGIPSAPGKESVDATAPRWSCRRPCRRLLALSLSLVALVLSDGTSAAAPAVAADPGTRIGQRTFREWLEAADEWWKKTGGDSTETFAWETRKHAETLLPAILECLSKPGHVPLIEAMSRADPKRQPVGIDEWTRASALWLLYALNRTAAPAIPDLLEMLKDRDWKQRIYVANAFQYMGQRVGQIAPTALEDLKSDSESIRQQGVLITAACAQYDEAMVTKLVDATRDSSSLVKQTAIGFLSNLMFVSPQAGACLFQIRQSQGPDAGYVSQTLRIREAEQRRGRLCAAKHPEESRSLRPIIDR